MHTRDLSHAIESDMPVFPGDPDVSVEPHATVDADGYRVSAVELGSHTGTHVDAPSHTEADGRAIDAVDVDRFAFDAVLADCTGMDPREAIERDALPATDADLLVVRTGWDEHWGEPTYLDHPFLAPDAAAFCVDQGYDVAVDALNVDPTPTDGGSDEAAEDEPAGIQAHHALLGANQLIFENLTDLSGLPDRFEVLAFPLALRAGDGSPVRVVARYE